MRLMGVAKLESLTRCGLEGLAGAVSALLSELTFTQWRRESELRTHFPSARCANGSVQIPLGETHCVEIIVNYDRGMVLIVSAGAISDERKANSKGKRAA